VDDTGKRIYRRLALTAAAVFAAAALMLYFTLDDVGMAWDEGNDIRMAAEAHEWFSQFSQKGFGNFRRAEVERLWEYEWKQHPAVTRIAYAAAYVPQGAPETLRWKAFRAGPIIVFSLLAAGVFLFGARRLGSAAAGFGAAAAMVFMPRMFGHGQIVETDLMLCAVWFAAAAAFLDGLEDKWASIGFGVLMGLLPAVKFSGLFACVPFLLYGAVFERRRMLRNLAAAALISPIVFYLVQPMYWHTPFASLKEYAGHFLNPDAQGTIVTYYFGKYYPKSPPWSYPWVMTALVLPLPTLALAAAGIAAAIKKRGESAKLIAFIALNAVFLLALFSPPRVAIYDGERLLMPVFPFWALLAGAGLHAVFGRYKVPARAAAVAVFAAILAFQTFSYRPNYLCYYNELAGGVGGAAKRGLEVMYWGEAFTPQFARRMNERLPAGARIATIGYFAGNLLYFQRMGLLREDFQIVDYGHGDADFLLAFNRMGVLDPLSAYLMKKVPPVIGQEWKGRLLCGVWILEPGKRFLRQAPK